MSGNPFLAKAEKEAAQPGGSGTLYAEGSTAYAQAGGVAAGSQYGAPPVAGAPGRGGVATGGRMTMQDVIVKSAISFFILLVGAAVGWNLVQSGPWLVLGAGLVAFVIAMFVIFKKSASPILVVLYSIFEGMALGGISKFYQAYGEANGNGNLVLQAVGATLIVFAVMLFVYSSKLVRVTSRTRKIFSIMLISYVVIAFISLIAALFGVGGGFGFYGMGGIGIALCLFAVGLASFSLVIDFDNIVKTTQYGVPEKESWRMAFGLMVSLVWLYLEILRLLAILNRN